MLLKTIAAASVFPLIFAAPCSASIYYVSMEGGGSSCLFNAPCATFQDAHNAAKHGDTIVCLSMPKGNNAVTINRSITIDCTNARADIRDGATGNAFVGIDIRVQGSYLFNGVSTADPLRRVRLRGLSINGAASTGDSRFLDRGIDIRSAAAVHIEDCVISNVRQQGLMDQRTGGQTRLFVQDSVISGNGGAGIVAASSAVGITVLDNVRLENNAYGIAAATGNNVFINRSVISGNTTAGVEADGGAQVEVSNSAITHNTIGVQAFGTIRLRENDIKFSNTAIQGATISMGANRFSGHGALGTAPTPATGAPADVFN